ncbi:nitrate- and nitrite sensing domain-containing protein [Spirillospora sp. NPDC029432]|uniref:sensor histidine kinase n=1 Tax=Spirillospora sp. NPDC029432 TaxID=3154599 RepID=UPI00345463F4
MAARRREVAARQAAAHQAHMKTAKKAVPHKAHQAKPRSAQEQARQEPPRKNPPPPETAPAKNPRRRPIRLRITALLLVPLMSLIGLWAFAAGSSLGPALDKYDYTSAYEKITLPGLYLVNQLQTERQLSVVALSTREQAGGNAGERQKLAAQRARVDGVQAAFRTSALSPEAKEAADPKSLERLDEAIKLLDRVPKLRAAVDSGDVQTLDIIDGYSLTLDSIVRVFSGLVIVNDLDIFQQGRALIQLGNARAFVLREDAIVTAALAKNGQMTEAEHRAFVQSVALGRREFDVGMSDLSADVRAPLAKVAATPAYKQFRQMETAIAGADDNRLPAAAADWPATLPRLEQAWGQAVTQSSLALNELAKPIGERVVTRLAVAGGFGLLAVVASITLSLLAARSLSRELRGLQRAALRLAEDRLPGVVARLRRGEEVDVQAEAPPLIIGRTTEVGRVGDAFTRVQRTALETAVSEAHLRKGISRVFLNVAWRSQSLLHRQLNMLDEMERGTSDPKALEDLFRLDHLTTRMRRHAEGLVILSGASPGRGWSRPVHVDDVLRAAVAEVEDYTRVEVVVVSAQSALIGEVVADVIHLLAELIENATVFSPPPTEVLVRGEMGANGFAVDIVDRGIGLDPAEMAALNERLARPPEFDLADSDRLGLFVVGRLAARHGIKVALQPSLYGGVSAVVLVPRKLIVDVNQPEDEAVAGAAANGANGNGKANGNGNGNGAQERTPVISTPAERSQWSRPARTIEAEVWRNPAAEPGTGGPPAAPGNDATLSAPVPEAGGPAAPPIESLPPVDVRRPQPPPVAAEPPPGTAGPPGSRPRAPLPRRVRQANLAPELRNAAPPPPAAATPSEPPRPPFEDRSAEASRDLFASLQAGWLRGRDEDEGPSGNNGRDWRKS